MKFRLMHYPASALIAALLLPHLYLLPAQADGSRYEREERRERTTNIEIQDRAPLYLNDWSASDLIGALVLGKMGRRIGEVRDIIVNRDGRIVEVEVEVGGLFGIGDQHIGVLWHDVRIHPDLQWMQVPLREIEKDTFYYAGGTLEEERVPAARASRRVSELIGDYVKLEDAANYGLVTDLIFSSDGSAQKVEVRRLGSPWGPGWDYVYPYAGYKSARYAHEMPFTGSSRVPRFDYVSLSKLGWFSEMP